MSPAPSHPALDRVAAVATALGQLRERVVFIGGAIAPLLQTEPPFPRARPTSDVDGVFATTSYTEAERFQEALTARGFRPDLADIRHAHRWRAPNGTPCDLVPAGRHLGGSGNPWDEIAIATSVRATLGSGVGIRHVAAPAFLAQKWAAHDDRGRSDPLNSRDLEDLLALLASRPTLLQEIALAPAELRAYVSRQAAAFLANPDSEDLLAAHLNNPQDPGQVAAAVRAVLQVLARESGG